MAALLRQILVTGKFDIYLIKRIFTMWPSNINSARNTPPSERPMSSAASATSGTSTVRQEGAPADEPGQQVQNRPGGATAAALRGLLEVTAAAHTRPMASRHQTRPKYLHELRAHREQLHDSGNEDIQGIVERLEEIHTAFQSQNMTAEAHLWACQAILADTDDLAEDGRISDGAHLSIANDLGLQRHERRGIAGVLARLPENFIRAQNRADLGASVSASLSLEEDERSDVFHAMLAHAQTVASAAYRFAVLSELASMVDELPEEERSAGFHAILAQAQTFASVGNEAPVLRELAPTIGELPEDEVSAAFHAILARVPTFASAEHKAAVLIELAPIVYCLPAGEMSAGFHAILDHAQTFASDRDRFAVAIELATKVHLLAAEERSAGFHAILDHAQTFAPVGYRFSVARELVLVLDKLPKEKMNAAFDAILAHTKTFASAEHEAAIVSELAPKVHFLPEEEMRAAARTLIDAWHE